MPDTPATPSSRTLYLVDGTSQLFRAYFALPRLTNADDLPTHAVYGFTTMLRRLLNEQKPEHLAVAFDLPGATFRHDRYAEYKANRPESPEELNVQVPYAKRVCEAFRIPVLELEGYEADDLIATYARLAREAGYEVVVVASDKDLLQLVGEGVRVLNPVKNEWLDPEGVRRSFGVAPERVADVLGLMGDSVDNIPGVRGVGEKTALAMIRTYGSLEAVLERAGRFVTLFDARAAALEAIAAVEAEAPLSGATADRLATALAAVGATATELRDHEDDETFRARLEALEASLDAVRPEELRGRAGEPGRAVAKELRESKRELKALDKGSSRRVWYAVREHAETARLSRELATVDRQVPVKFDDDGVASGPLDRDGARALFRELGFRGLLAELEEGGDSAAASGSPAAAPTEHRSILTAEVLEEVVSACRTAGRLALATEIAGPDALRAEIVGVSLAHDEGRAAYLPIGHAYLGAPAQLALETIRRVLGPVLADPAVAKLAHDLKRELHVLRRAGLPVEGWELDTRLAAFLLNPGRSSLDLGRVAEEFLGRAPQAPEAEAADRAAAPIDSLARSSSERADAVLRLGTVLRARLEDAGLGELYRTIDGPLVPLLGRMEERGIRIEPGALEAMSREMEGDLERLRLEIHDLAGTEFNVDSPKQLREVLFERLGMKPRRKTAKSRVSSTDARTLEELATEHPIARRLLEYRELAKLKGTYADSLPQLVNPETGRIHTSYDPAGAATGRLSSSDPNLQNIPARTPAGLRIRSAFVPEPGCLFLASDYSQVELRILAHLSGDPELMAAFRRGDDIHRHTASLVYGVAPDLVSDAMRRRAKAVNFGIVYGMSEIRLAAEQEMRRAEAREFIRAYFERFRGVKEYIERTREAARRDGVVRTLFGRVRYFPELHHKVGRAVQEQALRAAVNTTVQGTAADLMKMAMLHVDRAVREAGLEAWMLLQVHDELLLEVREPDVEATGRIVRRAMEGVHRLEVPLVVDHKVGRSWKEVT